MNYTLKVFNIRETVPSKFELFVNVDRKNKLHQHPNAQHRFRKTAPIARPVYAFFIEII
jgi:hypothetical protein